VFQINPADTTEAALRALEVGYRHIDTAEMYGNEKEVGEAIRRSGLPREEVFVTSKLSNRYHARDEALRAFDQTLSDLGFDYLDLFLVHWPLPGIGDYVETWRAMEEIYQSGRAKAVGVSNFQADHILTLFERTETVPAVNQIELHPYFTQENLRAFNEQHTIATEAWSPIAQGRVLGDVTLKAIAERYERTPAQIVLRWHIHAGNIVFPKSVNPARMEENFRLFDFDLALADVAAITAMNRDERIGPDPDKFNWVP
jgi:2,5-diketo-D-gluconate reductase A